MDEFSKPASAAYVLAAHPDMRASRVNRLLVERASTVPSVQVRDLYGSYPDYDIDIGAEQEAVARAQLLVLLHPIQWYSMPALMKLWLDEVLQHGWAYGHGGTALVGKDLWLVASTGAPEPSYHPQGYNRYFFDAFLPPYEQTAALCGMRFLPPMLLHGAHRAGLQEIEAHAEVLRHRLETYPDWPEIADLPACPACEVPQADRPALPPVGGP